MAPNQVAGTVPLTPASPKKDQTLTATPTCFLDPDNDPITYAYQWKLNGVAVARWTGPTLDVTANQVATEVLELVHNGFTSG